MHSGWGKERAELQHSSEWNGWTAGVCTHTQQMHATCKLILNSLQHRSLHSIRRSFSSKRFDRKYIDHHRSTTTATTTLWYIQLQQRHNVHYAFITIWYSIHDHHNTLREIHEPKIRIRITNREKKIEFKRNLMSSRSRYDRRCEL